MTGVMGLVLAAGKGSRMRSELPKVLHEVNGKPMVEHAIGALKDAGVDNVCCVVGYREDLVRERLGNAVGYAVQTEQRGTGHAVMSAREQMSVHGGAVVVVYGDAPLLRSDSIAKLRAKVVDDGYDCALLSFTLDTPPAAGRIIRDDSGAFVEIIEEQDCNEEQKKIGEINVGVYCFRIEPLLEALDALGCNNSQGEYYLTDVPKIMRDKGGKVEVISTDDILETLGVNDPFHLQFAEAVSDIAHAESVMPLLDAALEMSRKANATSDT